MSKQGPSSTEQLLDIVRSKEQPKSVQQPDTPPPMESTLSSTADLYQLAFKYAKLIVEIRKTALCILAVEQRSLHPSCEHFIIPLVPSVRNDDEKLAEFLREKITFCAAGCKCIELWVQLPLDSLHQTLIEVSAARGPQLDKAVYWLLKSQIRDLDEKTHFIDYRVKSGLNKKKALLQVEATVAPYTEINRMKELFKSADLSLTGMIAKQCAVNATVHALPAVEESLLTLYVDDEFSSISIFSNNEFAFTRTIRTGISSFLEPLKGTAYEENSEEEFSPVSYSPYPHNSQEIFALIEPVALRLARQIERTISHIGSKSISTPKRIYLAGDYCWSAEFKDFISRQTGIETVTLPTPAPVNLPFTHLDAKNRPDAVFALLYATLFVEKNDGINLLHSFSVRRKLNTKRLIHLISTGALAAGVLFLFISCVWQYTSNRELVSTIETVKQKIEESKPLITQQTLLSKMAELERRRQQAKDIGKNIVAPALLAELNTIQSSNVKLLEVQFIAGATPYTSKNRRVAADSAVLDGIVIGEPHEFNTSLAMYISKLGQHQFFSVPTVTLREEKQIPHLGTVLHFMLHCTISPVEKTKEPEK